MQARASAAEFKDIFTPPSPPPANRSARGARPQPIAAPLPGMLLRPASNSCGRLVTRPPLSVLRARRPLARLRGAAGRDSGGSPWAAGPALGDSRHRRPCFSRHRLPCFSWHRLPRDPENRARQCPQLRALPARAPCKGRGAALAAERGAGLGQFVLRGGQRGKRASVFAGDAEQRSASKPGRGGACLAPRYAPGQERPYGERFKPLKFNLGTGTFPRLETVPP